MFSIECNYEIYDKELLIIVQVFEKQYSKCVETSMKEFIRVISDHYNFKHFMTIK